MKASEFVMNDDEREMAGVVQACIDAHGDDDEPNDVVVLKSRNRITGQFELLIFNILYDGEGGAEILPLATVFDNNRNVIQDYDLPFDAEDDMGAGLNDYSPQEHVVQKTFFQKLKKFFRVG